jgi:hypothetical protein
MSVKVGVKAVKSFITLATKLAQFTKICRSKYVKFTVLKAIIWQDL